MYNIEVKKDVERILKKLAKKDKVSSGYISKKIKQIKESPYHFKPLRAPMQNFRRVHIGNFVLVYSIDENRKTVIIEKYEHHDIVYKN